MPLPPRNPRLLYIQLLLTFVLVIGVLFSATAQRQVQGLVLDASSKSPLSLATITISGKGSPAATRLTDSHGRFSFTAAAGAVLTVSYAGYRSKQVVLQDSSETITVLLERGDGKYDEVVVIGYVINVRGLNSITQSEGPLYIVDGVAITGDIRDINPADIESIDVLKDAAADVSMYTGIQTSNNPYHMLDACDYARMRRFAFNDADPVTYPIGTSDAKIFNTYEQQSIAGGYKNYDWLKAVTHNNAPLQNYSLGVSNGVGKSRVYFSGNYLNQAGILTNTGFTRYSGHYPIPLTELQTNSALSLNSQNPGY